jgi:hypothetical protein
MYDDRKQSDSINSPEVRQHEGPHSPTGSWPGGDCVFEDAILPETSARYDNIPLTPFGCLTQETTFSTQDRGDIPQTDGAPRLEDFRIGLGSGRGYPLEEESSKNVRDPFSQETLFPTGSVCNSPFAALSLFFRSSATE